MEDLQNEYDLMLFEHETLRAKCSSLSCTLQEQTYNMDKLRETAEQRSCMLEQQKATTQSLQKCLTKEQKDNEILKTQLYQFQQEIAHKLEEVRIAAEVD